MEVDTMAYKFVEKRKTVQEEMAYIVYMIVDSYFNKTICKNQAMSNRFYLCYTEMKEATQEAKEQRVITQAARAFKAYEKVLEGMNCENVIAFREGRYVLDFTTGFEHVYAEVNRKGNYKIQLLTN